MSKQFNPGGIIAVTVVAIIYGVVVLMRARRLRKLAQKLGARYIDVGRFVPGKIEGSDFQIEAYTVGMGKSKTYRTRVRINARGLPGRHLFKRAFFERYPDWKHVKIMGPHEERVFLKVISVPRYRDLKPEEQERLRAWLGRFSFSTQEFLGKLKESRVKEILLEEAGLSVSFRGVVTNLKRIQSTLDALRRFAG